VTRAAYLTNLAKALDATYARTGRGGPPAEVVQVMPMPHPYSRFGLDRPGILYSTIRSVNTGYDFRFLVVTEDLGQPLPRIKESYFI
jgi:hypothetical protein